MTQARDKANIPVLNFQSKGIDDNADATAITIDGSERVGIGIASPLDQLSVLSSGIGKVRFGAASGSVSNLLLSIPQTGDSGFQFNSNQLNMFSYGDIAFFPSTSNISGSYPNSEKMRIKNNGNVGIGTSSPAENLQVMDTASNKPQIRIETSDGGNKRLDLYVDGSVGTIAADQSSQSLAFRTASTEAMRIDSSGNITQPLQPSFRAGPTGAQGNISINAWNTIAFESELVDTGSNFASNTFTAPVTGTYGLSGAIYLQSLDSAATSYDVQIHTSNDSYTIWHIVPAQILSADTGFYAFSGSVFADMDAGDTAIIRIYQEGGTVQTNINTSSVFTGHLLG